MFLQNQITDLGLNISSDGIKVSAEKLRPILERPSPTNVTQLKSFLGMIPLYHKHIPQLSSRIPNLYALLKKNQCCEWTTQHSIEFDETKSALQKTQILHQHDPEAEAIIMTDACQYGIGAILYNKIEGKLKLFVVVQLPYC